MTAQHDPSEEREVLHLRLHEREVHGVDDLDDDRREELLEAAEDNPDPQTRRESIEQELMEQGRSHAGAEIGD